MNLTKLTNDELRERIEAARQDIVEMYKELNRYKVVRCSICGFDDIAYRGEDLPFITWSSPSGHPLCPKCTGLFKHNLPEELTISPVDEIMALLD